MTDQLLVENLTSDVYDVLLDNKDNFLTVDNIYTQTLKDKPSYMSSNDFYHNVRTACFNTCNTYNNIYKMYKTKNYRQFPVFIFSNSDQNQLYNKLLGSDFCTNSSPYNNSYNDPYEDHLNYLEEVSKNYSLYSDFSPNTPLYENTYPLQFLASCKSKDTKRCADITEKLFMNYDDIVMGLEETEYDNSSALRIAKDNDNLHFMNLYYKRKIDSQQKVINALEHKVNTLTYSIEKKHNNHESLNIFPHLFVVFISSLIFFLIKFTFI